MITKYTPVEDIVEIEGAFEYCLGQGVSLITCSGAFSQTLGRLLMIKRIKDSDAFIAGLNAYLQESPHGKG
jgi:hypothetical protein